MASLTLSKILKRYGKTEVIHGVDLDVADGEFVVLVGPSGCGKSTLLRIIAGLEEVNEGEVYIGGQLMNEIDPAKRGVAMVFQSYALYPHMSVADNMGFGLRMAGRPKQEIRERVTRAAEILHLTPYLKRRPKELSGGQKQRVAIGRAIVREPEIFLFDEPLSNLDAELRVQMRIELSKLHSSLQTTMVYVTHDQVEAMTLAEKIVVLNDGKIEQIGSPRDLYSRPANLFVAGFIGSPRMNFLKVKVVESRFGEIAVESDDFLGGTLTIPTSSHGQIAPGSEATLGIRPEHLTVVPQASGKGLLTIEVVEMLGESTYVHGLTPANNRLTIGLRGFNDLRHADSVGFDFEFENVHLFGPSGQVI
jgi:ABC-type sugar transport system ATPase subunit